MNAFEQGSRKVIPAVLIYARHGKDVLMLERAPRDAQDVHAGKHNGLGGKSDPDEAAPETAAREFFEEASLHLAPARFVQVGVLHFPNFKPRKAEDWLVHVFVAHLTDVERAALPASGPEGKLHFVPGDALAALNLWEGDRHFLPLVLQGKPFAGTFWYQDGRLVRHLLQPL